MFSAGTRVYVHSSNITGKRLGPKVHSLGYASTINQSFFIRSIKDFPIKDQSFIATPMTIVFTRYGRQQSTRRETRNFVAIIPAFTNTKGLNIVKNIEEMLDLFSDSEFCKNEDWTRLAKVAYGMDYIGTLLPVRCTKVTRMGWSDVCAWGESILRNDVFKHLMDRNHMLPPLRNLFVKNQEMFGWIRNACRSGSGKNHLFDWASATPSHTEDFVYLLRAINTAFTKRTVESSMKAMTLARDRKQLSNEVLTSWLTANMFDGNQIIRNKQDMLKSASLPSDMQNLIHCMRIIRGAYLNLKPKYV